MKILRWLPNMAAVTQTLSQLPAWQQSDGDSVSQHYGTFPVVDGAFCPSCPSYSVLSSGQHQPYRDTVSQNSDALCHVHDD